MRPFITMTLAATAGAAVIGAALLVSPAGVAVAAAGGPAASRSTATTCDGPGGGWMGGRGAGQGMTAGPRGAAGGGGAGAYGRGAMAGTGVNLPAAGTLTTAQKATLADLAEEEKLAHDVYAALAASSGDARFTRISSAEEQHLSSLRLLMTRYKVTDPTAGKAVGVFTSTAAAQEYKDLVAKGKASLAAALTVGQAIEMQDVADLTQAAKRVTAADVTTVYSRLTTASTRRLTALGG